MTKEEKCLASEAMEKCPCEICQLVRKGRDIQMKFIKQMYEKEKTK